MARRTPKTAPRPMLRFLPLEDRLAPSITTSQFGDGQLNVFLSSPNDTATVTANATAGSFTVSGTGFTTKTFTGVTALDLGDVGGGIQPNQTVVLTNAAAGVNFALSKSVNIYSTEVVRIELNNATVTTGSFFNVSRATTITRTGTGTADIATGDQVILESFNGIGSAANPLRLNLSKNIDDLRIDTSKGNGDQFLVAVGGNVLDAETNRLLAGSGTVRLLGGTIFANNSNVFGSGTGLELAAGTTFDSGGGQVFARLSGSGTVTTTGTGTEVITIGDANDSTFDGTFKNGSGKIAVVKQGTGKLTLTNPGSDFTGNVTVNAGTLVGAAGNSVPAPTTGVFGNPSVGRTIGVNSGGTLTFATNDTFGNAAAKPALNLDIQGGTVTNNANLFTTLGPVTMNGGTLAAPGGFSTTFRSYQLTGDFTVTGTATATVTTSGTNSGIQLNNNTTFTVAAGAKLAIAAALYNPNVGIGGTANPIFAGGGTTTLNLAAAQAGGANGYTGTTTVNGGTLQIGGNFGGDGAIQGGIVLNSGGTLRLLQSDIITNAAGVQVNSGTTFDMNGFDDVVGFIGGGGAIPNTKGTGLTLDNVIGTNNFFGVISGTGGFRIRGAISVTGVQQLTGNNTYTGTTTVTKGTLQIGNGGNGGSHGTGSVVNNGTLNYNRTGTLTIPGAVSGTGATTYSGGATYIHTGASTSTGPVTVSAGTLQFGNGGTTGIPGSGTITNNANVAFNRSDKYSVSTLISGSGTLTHDGTGELVVLAPNDYVGNTVVNAGTVRLGDGVTGGSFGKAGDLINGGTVIYNRPSNVVVNRKLSGSGLYAQEGPGGMELANATNDFTGDFEIRAGLVRVTAAPGGLNPTTGALGNPQAAGRTVSVVAGATLRFEVNDTFGDAGSVPLVALSIAGTVTNTGAFITALGPVTLAGGTLTSTDGFASDYGAYQFTGPVTVGGSAAAAISGKGADSSVGVSDTVFTVADATGDGAPDLTVAVPLRDKNSDYSPNTKAAATFTGKGTVLLTAANTYTGGTTATGGVTLLVDGSVGTVTVQANSSLGGAGGVGNVAVAKDGFLLPGTTTVAATLNTLNVAVAAGGFFGVKIFGPAAGQFDALAVAGTVDVTGATFFDFSPSAGPLPVGKSIVVLANDGTDKVVGTFTGLPEGTRFAGSKGDIYRISYVGGDGNDVALTAQGNSGPTTVPDSGTTAFNTAVTVAVLANDSDPDGDAFTLAGTTDGTGGKAVANPDGTVTYTPNAGFAGKDTFTYSVTDAFGKTTTGTAAVTVQPPPNVPPTAKNDAATASANAAVTVNVLANDSDSDGGTLAVTGTGAPASGKVVVNGDNTIAYTPNAGFVGTDGFSYTISDGQGGTATANVVVTVTAQPNTPPTAVNDAATATAGTPKTMTVLANDSDADGDVLAVTGATNPANGVAVVNANGTITYTANAGFSGTDTFTYTISDGRGGSSTAGVAVTVSLTPPVNTPPAAGNDSAATASATAVTVNVLANDTDADGDTLTVTALGAVANGSAVIDGGGGIRFTPNAGFSGVTSFNYTISDGRGGSAIGTVSVTVSPPATTDPTRLIGFKEFAAGTDAGTAAAATLFNPNGSTRFTVTAFDPSFTGGARTAAADFDGDGIADLVVGTGPGRATRVRILSGATQAELFGVDPFEAAFTGGVYVTAGDLNGDGTPDLIITPDEGGGPRVDVYSGRGFGKLASFFGIDDTSFRGGARSNTGDLNGDGRTDLVVVAGFGGGPRVAGFDGTSIGGTPSRIFGDFFAFEQTLRNGIFVTTGDVNGDGVADLICGGGPGGGPRVTVFDGQALKSNTYNVLANFFGGNPDSRGGIRLAVKNLDNDNRADLVVGAGSGAGSRVTAYLGKNIGAGGTPPSTLDFDAFSGFAGGVFVG